MGVTHLDFERIVVPHDGSEAATHAAVYAERLPSRAVRLVRVEPNFQVPAPGSLENFRPDWREVRAEQVRQDLAPLAERFGRSGRDIEVAVRFGEVADEIVAAAADADLVVMATQGKGTLGRAAFGSVADRIACDETTSTVLLRGGGPTVAPSRIVVPLDGTDRAETALPIAARLARLLSVPIRLVHVVDFAPDALPSATLAPGDRVLSHEPEVAIYLREQAHRLASDDVAADIDVRTGTPAGALLEMLAPDDLVVMATRGRTGFDRWLRGSVSERLIAHGAAPILFVATAPRVT
jgi:nucleotide-binding universal stress UspA family protein